MKTTSRKAFTLPLVFLLALVAALLALSSANPIHAQSPAEQTVPADWALIPDGIQPGDSFRLLFVTSTTRNAASDDVDDYNGFVQAAAGDSPGLAPFAAGFRALISTAGVDAKDNTATTGAGVSIHWLGGEKVADDYADLYDRDWDSAAGMTEAGASYTGLVWTGGNRKGEKSGKRYAGAAEVRQGDLSDPELALSSPSAAASSESHPLYGLSPVFTVAAPEPEPTPTPEPAPSNSEPQFASDTAERSVAENSAVGTIVGDALVATDNDGDALTYSLTRSDAFEVDDSGQVTVAAGATLDYETTATYTVTVSVSDGEANDAIAVTISLINVDEAGAVSLLYDTGQPEAGGELQAALLDPDGSVTSLSWAWQRSLDGSEWEAIDGANGDAYTPSNLDVGYYLRAIASYADGHGPGKTAYGTTDDTTLGVAPEPEPQAQSTAPTAPGNLQATGGNQSVILSWTAATDTTITKYQYRQKTTGAYGNWTDMANSGASSSSHSVTGLTNGTAYTFQIRAVSPAGNGAASAEVTATPSSNAPGAPTGLSAAAATGGVTLSWTAPTHTGSSAITKYQYRQNRQGGWNDMGASSPYTVSNLIVGNLYTFEVRAVNSAGASPPSNTASATPTAPALGGLSASGQTTTTVTLTWTHDSTVCGSGCSYSYRYRTAPSGGTAGSWSGWASTTSQTTVTVTGLTAGTRYEFLVRGRVVHTVTQGSVIATTTGIAATTVPAKPTGLTARGLSRSVLLRWTNPNDATITGYQYRQKAAGGSYGAWTAVPAGGVRTSTYEISGLTNGTAYTFRIRAVNARGNSPDSDEVTATPTARTTPAAPANLTAAAGNTQVRLSWNNRRDASITRWEVRRKAGNAAYGNWTAISGSGPATTGHVVQNLTNGTLYTFQVRAVSAGGNGAASSASATPNVAASPRVTDIRIISSPKNGQAYNYGEVIQVQLTFSADRIAVRGTPVLELHVGVDDQGTTTTADDEDIIRWADYFCVQNGNQVVFHYTVMSADVDADGVSIPGVAIYGPDIGGGDDVYDPRNLESAIEELGRQGQGTTTVLGKGAAGSNDPPLAEHKVDGLQDLPASVRKKITAPADPALESVVVASAPRSGDTYRRDETIEFTVTFDSQIVSVDGRPTMSVTIGGDTRRAEYAGTRTSSAAKLVFTYTVRNGDVDADGISVPANPFNTDEADRIYNHFNRNPATLTFAGLGLGTTGDPALSGHKVSTLAAIADFTAEPGPGDTSVTLAWTNPATCGDGCTYQYRYQRLGRWSSWWSVWANTSSPTGHVVMGLVSGTRYAFEVQRRSGSPVATTAEAQATAFTNGVAPSVEPTPGPTDEERIRQSLDTAQSYSIKAGAADPFFGRVMNPFDGIPTRDDLIRFEFAGGEDRYTIVGHGQHPSTAVSPADLGFTIDPDNGGISYDGTIVTTSTWFERHLFDFSGGVQYNTVKLPVKMSYRRCLLSTEDCYDQSGSEFAIKTITVRVYPSG